MADTRYKSCASYLSDDESFPPDWVFSPVNEEVNMNLAIPESCCLSPCEGCTRRTHPSNIFTSVSFTLLFRLLSISPVDRFFLQFVSYYKSLMGKV